MRRSVYKEYERIRAGRKGVAVSEAVDGSCNTCHMTLRLQFYQELRLGEKILHCESCGRFIYVTPAPVETDELGPAAEEEPSSPHAVETRR